jgi:hypothetical protein
MSALRKYLGRPRPFDATWWRLPPSAHEGGSSGPVESAGRSTMEPLHLGDAAGAPSGSLRNDAGGHTFQWFAPAEGDGDRKQA